jgi:hypothetical protein
MQFQSRSAVIVVSGICILQQDRSLDIKSLRDNLRVISWHSSEFGKSSECFFVTFLEEQPARCVGIEDHPDAEDESRQDLEGKGNPPCGRGLPGTAVWSNVGIGVEGGGR